MLWAIAKFAFMGDSIREYRKIMTFRIGREGGWKGNRKFSTLSATIDAQANEQSSILSRGCEHNLIKPIIKQSLPRDLMASLAGSKPAKA